jgi:hypothetical protein
MVLGGYRLRLGKMQEGNSSLNPRAAQWEGEER